MSGSELWPLAWLLAAACALPWLLPETWAGEVPLSWRLGALAVLLATLPLLLRPHWRWLPAGLFLLAWTGWGLSCLARREAALPVGFVALEGRISAPWSVRGELRRGVLQIDAPESLRGLHLPLRLPLEGAPAPAPGTLVRFRAELLPVDPGPRFLAERPLWRARDAGSSRRVRLASALQFEPLGAPSPSLLLRLQTWAQARFAALPLAGTPRDLWGALTLGIPPAQDEVVSAFAESGTLHTLVVSGLQVTLVMIAVEALWRRVRLRGASVASALLGLLYAALVGFSAPVWRGLLMGLAWVFGRGSGWKLPPVATLHGALLLWLLAHPAAGCDPGFLLAWFALLGLLWGAEPLAALFSPLAGRWALPFARLVAPWLSTLPLLALFHGGAPLYGVAANLLLLPLVALLTPLCLLLTLLPLPGLLPAAAILLGWIGEGLVPVFARLVPLATGWLWPWLALALGWILLAQCHCRFRPTRALATLLGAGSLLLMAFRGTGTAPDTLSLEAVDVGQGDALLLRVPGGRATLVDTGPSPWSARRVARVLSRRGVRESVHLVLTHPHGDHAGGWATLARLWPLDGPTGPAVAGTDAWTPFAPPSGGILAARMRGEAWQEGEARFEVRWPPVPLALPDPNMLSMVLRVRWRDRELWLMGDALGIQERDLLDLGDPGPSTARRLLKPGHHGSRTATDPAWIAALRPELALITAPRRSEFPSPEVVAALDQAGVRVLLGGVCAGVRVAAAPGGWRVETGLGGGVPWGVSPAGCGGAPCRPVP